MKRLTVIAAMLALVPLLLFAEVGETKTMRVKGYYDDSNEKNFLFRVWSGDSALENDRIYHAGSITIDDRAQISIVTETTLFNWEIAGNAGTNVTLAFTITPLQAFKDGMYYIPKHTYKMYLDGGATQTHSFSTVSSGSSSYPGYRDSEAAGYAVLSARFSYTESVAGTWAKTGYCTVKVEDYDQDTASEFDYVSIITVEFIVL